MLKPPNPDLLPISQEDEFLPPVSGWTTFGGIFLVTTVFISVTVAAFTPLPVTVKARGIVRPSGEVKLVQSSVEGIVTNIDVKENQAVTQGTALVTLDSSRFNTRQAQLQSNLQQNSLQLQQISAQIKNLNLQSKAETDKINRAIASANADYSRITKEYSERQLNVQAQINEARANLQIAEEELGKATSDFTASEAALRASKSALKIAQQKFDRYQNIGEGALGKNQIEEAQFAVEQARESVAERTALLQSQKQTIMRQKQAVASAQARLQAVLANINPSDGLVKMSQEKIAQERAIGQGNLARLQQEKSSLLQRQSELNKQIENDNQELLQVKKDQSKTIINSPISGVILKLHLRNPNQTVRVGEEIAQIAPNNDIALMIKAKVSTEDIAKVKLGQKSQMRVSAYPYPDYGILEGEVIGISPDAIAPQNTGNNPAIPYYEVTIKPHKLYLKNNPKNALQSGMEMQVDIIAKNETVLQFILRKARILSDL